MKTIDFQITSLCNLNCKFCCDSLKKTNHKRIYDIYKCIETIAQTNIDTVSITGGEPLLHPDIIEIIEYIDSMGLENIFIN